MRLIAILLAGAAFFALLVAGAVRFHRRFAAAVPLPVAAPAAPVEAAAPVAVAVSAKPAPPPPAWTQEAPAIVEKGNRRVARAVGFGRTPDLALSRSAAEDRARAAIATLLHGSTSLAGEEVTVAGAQITRSFTAPDGTVYLELSAPVHR